jgi:hypothetical protein
MEEPTRRLLKALHLPALHIEGLYDAVAGDGFVQDVLNLSELILAVACGVANAAADPAGGADNYRDKDQQNPGELSSHHNDNGSGENETENLLQKLG